MGRSAARRGHRKADISYERQADAIGAGAGRRIASVRPRRKATSLVRVTTAAVAQPSAAGPAL